MKNYLFFLNHVRPYWLILIGSAIATGIVNLSTLIQPYLIKYIVSDVLTEKNLAMLNLIIIVLMSAVIVKGLSSYFQRYLMCLVAQNLIRDMRNEVFSHLQKLPLAFYENRKTGDLMARLTADVLIIQDVITNRTVNLVNDVLLLTGAFGWMFYKNWPLTLISILLAPLIAITTNKFARKIEAVTRMLQQNLSSLTSIMQEIISGMTTVKAFCREDYEFKRFEKANVKNLYFSVKSEKLAATQTPVIEFLTMLAISFVIWFGGFEVISGRLTVGEIFVFWGYLAISGTPITRLSTSYTEIKKALVSIERINELMDAECEPGFKENYPELPCIKGKVEFRNVSFNYKEGEAVLRNINLSVESGEIVALVGPSGSGKTTFVNLITRFYDPSEGEILIDDYNICERDLYSLRKQIGIVPQETVLFNGTIYENILYGRLEATKDEVENAAKKANAHDFIMSFPDGYETSAGERGTRLSGGQRQRIALARVILKNPRILILDEATSSLDSESENLIQDALGKIMKDRTSFVIAHRLSTIHNADNIIVIDDGEIKEMGTHDELMEKNGVYARLCAIQFQSLPGNNGA